MDTANIKVKAEPEEVTLDYTIVKDEYTIQDVHKGQEFSAEVKKEPAENPVTVTAVSKQKHKCLVCGKDFDTARHLQWHRAEHPNLRLKPSADAFVCEVENCGKVFAKQKLLQSHVKRHNPDKKFQCEICGKRFSEKGHRNTHVMFVHKQEEEKMQGRKRTCDQCGKVFWRKDYFMRHMSTHSDARDFKCPQCSMAFKLKLTLKAHMKNHRQDSPLSCDLCGKGFKQGFRLTAHLSSHQRLTCQYCGEKCSTWRMKRQHITLRHKGLPRDITSGPQTCPFCKIVLDDLEALKQHVPIHEHEVEDGLLQCDNCGWKCKEKGEMLVHMRGHFTSKTSGSASKSAPFTCMKCGKICKNRTKFARHQAAHSDEKPFNCDFCYRAFKLKDRLTHHLRNYHNIRKEVLEILKS
ncbi:gastrula zinc finger protein XlCGF57.1-like [Phlebotomus argentipes]|uniref:gastrula zinc finger protein XlCGF57.1-like n=1 Tax=Phlebotomus argentipes TaxID=94469 RepID=UPI002892BBE9|nr:gastrula zinc finger protein XlCGF57.1-like [Phlebotomus argentipes]